jgi:hypothetical protein
LTFNKGLLPIEIRKPTQDELKHCKIINITSDTYWNPENMANEVITMEEYENKFLHLKE